MKFVPILEVTVNSTIGVLENLILKQSYYWRNALEKNIRNGPNDTMNVGG